MTRPEFWTLVAAIAGIIVLLAVYARWITVRTRRYLARLEAYRQHIRHELNRE